VHQADSGDPQVVRGPTEAVGDGRPLLGSPDVEDDLAAEQHLAVDLADDQVIAHLPVERGHRRLVDPTHARSDLTLQHQPGALVAEGAEVQVHVVDTAGDPLRGTGALEQPGGVGGRQRLGQDHPTGLRALPRLVGQAACSREPSPGRSAVPVHGRVEKAQLPPGDERGQPRLTARPEPREGPLVEAHRLLVVAGPLGGPREPVAGVRGVVPRHGVREHGPRRRPVAAGESRLALGQQGGARRAHAQRIPPTAATGALSVAGNGCGTGCRHP
jgi:hypothetical protein